MVANDCRGVTSTSALLAGLLELTAKVFLLFRCPFSEKQYSKVCYSDASSRRRCRVLKSGYRQHEPKSLEGIHVRYQTAV